MTSSSSSNTTYQPAAHSILHTTFRIEHPNPYVYKIVHETWFRSTVPVDTAIDIAFIPEESVTEAADEDGPPPPYESRDVSEGSEGQDDEEGEDDDEEGEGGGDGGANEEAEEQGEEGEQEADEDGLEINQDIIDPVISALVFPNADIDPNASFAEKMARYLDAGSRRAAEKGGSEGSACR